jgi:hypothetical protein
MKEQTAEMLRQLELELLRMDDFQWRLQRLSPEELAEVAGILSVTASTLGKKALRLAEIASFIRPVLPRPGPELRS